MTLTTTNADQFFVTLPSNSSYEFYGNQEPSRYRTRLHSGLKLDTTRWEVGLVEFTYPRSWACVPNATIRMWTPSFETRGPVVPSVDRGTRTVPDTRYNDAADLVAAVNAVLVKMVADASGGEPYPLFQIERDGRARLELPGGYMLLLSGELACPLGFGSEKRVLLCGGGPKPCPCLLYTSDAADE